MKSTSIFTSAALHTAISTGRENHFPSASAASVNGVDADQRLVRQTAGSSLRGLPRNRNRAMLDDNDNGNDNDMPANNDGDGGDHVEKEGRRLFQRRDGRDREQQRQQKQHATNTDFDFSEQYTQYRLDLAKKTFIASFPLMVGNGNDNGNGNPDKAALSQRSGAGEQERGLADNDCTGRKWHPDTTSPEPGCSDSLTGYPTFWDTPDMMGVTMFESADACCKFYEEAMEEGMVCERNSDCKEPVSCEEQHYHLALTGELICTNDLNYPQSWNHPSYLGNMMFLNGEECCNTIKENAGRQADFCKIVNVCESSSTSSNTSSSSSKAPTASPVKTVTTASPIDKASEAPTFNPTKSSSVNPSSSPSEDSCKKLKFHPDAESGVGCSNSLSYPSDWDLPEKSFLWYDTASECCSSFGGDANCPVKNICDTDHPTSSPTSKPSSAPTAIPTFAPTSSPTSIPTGKPHPSILSAQPTTAKPILAAPGSDSNDGSCTTMRFHPDTPGICSNKDNAPLEWKDLDVFFDSGEECCAIFAVEGKCDVIDVCQKQGEQPSGTTDNNSATPGSSSCNAAVKWHPSAPGICSNADDLPADMMTLDIFVDSAEACCARFALNGECTVNDVCANGDNDEPATPVDDGSCALRQWHPATRPGGCSNDDEILDAWLELDGIWFDSSEACCNVFALNGECEVTNICDDVDMADGGSPDDGSCESVRYHPDPDRDVQGVCTNSPIYPDEWNSMPLLFFNSYADCCEVFEHEGLCTVVNVCGEDFTMEVTPEPTSLPTTKPSRKPTAAPTNAPTGGQTNQPTSAPTKAQTTAPTSSPTQTIVANSADCSTRKWYPDFTTHSSPKCTNGLNYSPSWNDPEIAPKFLMDSYEACCKKFFGPSCSKFDVCPIDSSPSSPTHAPTTVSTMSPTQNMVTNSANCDSRKWYPIFEEKKCSNSLDYPPAWDIPSNAAMFLLDSRESCCQKYFGPSCTTVDVCSDITPSMSSPTHMPTSSPTPLPTSIPTPQPTSNPTQTILADSVSCDSRKWFPDFSNYRCMNSLDYPSSWNIASNAEMFLLKSAEDCCEKFFRSGCTTVVAKECAGPSSIQSSGTPTAEPTAAPTPVPTPQPTKSPGVECDASELWHISNDFQKCTNSFDFPEAWLEPHMKDEWMFESSEDCCAQFFMSNCHVEDICAPGGVLTKEPTKTPTVRPTASPTHLPTANPTTPLAVSTCENKWHPKSATEQICSNSLDYPSTWDDPVVAPRFLLNSALECCNIFYTGQECTVDDVCPADSMTSMSQESCEERRWHPTSLEERRCTNDSLYPPLWNGLGDQFLRASAQDCCDAFYSDRDCKIDNICPVPVVDKRDCEGKKWHPKSATERACSNSDEFPAVWSLPPMNEQFLVDSAQECCVLHYSGGDCKIIDICN